MQPNNLPESIAAIKHLESTGEYIFDLTLSGPRLVSILFNSRSNLRHKKYYHLFVGEITCGHWAISRLRKYSWETLFYWLCDCNYIKEVLKYNGSIHHLKQWTRELLAYKLIIIHRKATMMKDVDGISRYVDPLVRQYNMIATCLHIDDVTKRPFAYSFDVFISSTNPRHVVSSSVLSISITTVSITPNFALSHSPIKFSPVFITSLILSILLPDANSRVLSFPVVSSSKIALVYFDSVIDYLASILLTLEYNTLQHFICESNLIYVSIENTISSNVSISYTT